MRKFIIIGLCLVFLVACNEKKENVSNTNEQTATNVAEDSIVISDEKAETIKLELPEGQDYDETKTYSLKELEEDYNAFTEAFIKADEVSDGDSWDVKKLLDSVKTDLIKDGMTDSEFQLVLRNLVANLNNNDTKLAPSKAKEYYIGKNRLLFPVEILFINGGVYINENTNDGSVSIGDKVLSINSKDIQEITKELSALTSYNKNSFAMDYNLSNEFKLLYFEKYGESENFEIKVDSNGTEKTVKIPANKYEGIALSTISKDEGIKTEEVVYNNTTYSENKVSYLRLGTVNSEDSEMFFNQLDNAINAINEHDPIAVVIDFTNNRTTDPETIRGIYSRFIKEDSKFYVFGEGELMKPVKKADVSLKKEYSLMFDNRSSSQANQLIMALSNNSVHKSAGINTSSGTISYNDFEKLELPNTGILFKYPKSILKVTGQVELFELGTSPSEYKSDVVFSGMKASIIELLYKSFCSV